jgi:hypothetical protein
MQTNGRAENQEAEECVRGDGRGCRRPRRTSERGRKRGPGITGIISRQSCRCESTRQCGAAGASPVTPQDPYHLLPGPAAPGASRPPAVIPRRATSGNQLGPTGRQPLCVLERRAIRRITPRPPLLPSPRTRVSRDTRKLGLPPWSCRLKEGLALSPLPTGVSSRMLFCNLRPPLRDGTAGGGDDCGPLRRVRWRSMCSWLRSSCRAAVGC